MSVGDIIIIVAIVIALVAVGLYFLNRFAYKKMSEQQQAIERNKQTVSIFVIDKKKEKPKNANMPKALLDQIPKFFANRKTYLVKAKVGPQILTLMCDKKVFEMLNLNKTVKVDLAGIYIVSIKGVKQDSIKDKNTVNNNGQKNNPFYAFIRKFKS